MNTFAKGLAKKREFQIRICLIFSLLPDLEGSMTSSQVAICEGKQFAVQQCSDSVHLETQIMS